MAPDVFEGALMNTLRMPAGPPTLLPGPTAYQWVRRQTQWLIAGVALLPLMGLAQLLAQPTRAIVVVVVVAMVMACAVRAGRAAISEMRAEARERSAGYTTLNVRRYRHLWQLDPKLGTVVRPPDQAR